MKHKSSQTLFAYWDTQRGTRAAPDRADIDPAAIRHVLADTFVLAADFAGQDRFRLAGTKVCAMFGRELKDQLFLDLWGTSTRKDVHDLLAIVNDETLGVVAGATGITAAGDEIELEFVLLPLARRGHARVRALGVLAPLTLPYWFGSHPVTELRLGTLRHVGPEVEHIPSPSLAAAASGGRVSHGFVVYDGGRQPVGTDEPPTAA
jgi:hypothetical protein